jgi:hypothetical protein
MYNSELTNRFIAVGVMNSPAVFQKILYTVVEWAKIAIFGAKCNFFAKIIAEIQLSRHKHLKTRSPIIFRCFGA